MTNITRYEGESTRGLSPALWGNPSQLFADHMMGKLGFFFDDFDNFSKHISDQDVQGYSSYIDTGVTIQSLATMDLSEGEYGVLEVAGNDADNDEGSITTGGNTGVLALISDTAGQKFDVCFEARVKKASVADNALAFFVGLASQGLAGANTLVDDTGEIADNDFLGFRVKHDNGEEIDAVHNKASGTITEPAANTHTMVADTWVKLGFRYRPGNSDAKQITFYVDGVEQSSYVTATAIATANFPDGEELALLLATKVGGASESKFQMDWWAVAQYLQ